MQDWFRWNGVSCLEYGMRVTQQPTITIPKERLTDVTVPGRPGTLHLPEGASIYEDIELTATCYIPESSQVPAIAAWLQGEGKVEFANRAGGFYYARLADIIQFNRIVRGRTALTFELKFVCKPFWYALPIVTVSFSDQGYLLHGEGTVFSEPIITVNGSGDITLMVNETTVYLNDLEDSITLDCAAGIAYSIGENDTLVWAGEKVALEDGEWPTLKPVDNNNLFNWTLGSGASLSSITVQPNWRYL